MEAEEFELLVTATSLRVLQRLESTLTGGCGEVAALDALMQEACVRQFAGDIEGFHEFVAGPLQWARRPGKVPEMTDEQVTEIHVSIVMRLEQFRAAVTRRLQAGAGS